MSWWVGYISGAVVVVLIGMFAFGELPTSTKDACRAANPGLRLHSRLGQRRGVQMTWFSKTDPYGLTEAQSLLFDALSDGQPWTKAELLTVLGKETASYALVQVHIYNMRQKLKKHGMAIRNDYHPSRSRAGYRLEYV